MKLVEVFRYELEHQLRSWATWLYAVLLLGFAVANAVDVGPLDAFNANGPYQIARDSVITGMIGLVVSAGLFGDAALRDFEAGMDPLLFTSPQRTIDHLGGRYLAALTTNALLLLAVPIGYALPTLIGYPDPAHFGPFRIAAVIQPWVVLLVPNMAFSGAVLFTVALVSRNLMPVYLVGFGLFMGELFFADLGVLAFDWSGLGALNAMTKDWTSSERNSRLVGWSASLLLNRVLLLAATGGVFLLLHKRFRFAHADGGGAPRELREASDSAPVVTPRAARVAASFGFKTSVRQTLGIARNALAELAVTPWFAGVLIACTIWCAALAEKAANRFDAWPVTMLLTAGLSRDFFAGLHLFVALYAGELVWKDRSVGVADIADAAPVADGTALLGRFLALVVMVAMVLAAAMLGSILNQLSQGYYDVEPWLYVRVLFGMNLVDLALFAALAMAIHVVVNHKYVGHIAAMMAMVLPFTGPWFRHNLLVYAGDPGWTYSDMNGFGPFLAPFVWFKLYWAGWALLVAVCASVLWVRGRESGARARFRQARERFTDSLRRTAGVAVALIVAVGGFIFYNTNVLNAFDADATSSAVRAEYAKRYGTFENLPQPAIERALLRVEIYPEKPAADVRGSYWLVNRTAAPIDSIHLSTNTNLVTRSISFDRTATPVLTDTALGYRIYALDRPLAPGDSMQLSFDVGFRDRGFPNGGFQTAVVENGTHFDRDWLPIVGFQPPTGREHDDNVRVVTIVGTSIDQVVIAQGVRQEWTQNGRRYFHYETETPQRFDAPVISGKYAVRSDRWTDSSAVPPRDVTLSVYHHAEHDRNVDSFVRSMKASLAYYTTQLGPYEGAVMRIVEVPRYERAPRAYPNVITFPEGNFIRRTRPGQTDNVFFDTAYEIAHQWWDAVGVRDGQGFIRESLASYSALMVLEKADGQDAARRFYTSLMSQYFTERGSATNEVPILDAREQAYIIHGKGPLAMYLMRDYIGEDAVNTALRRFIDKTRVSASSLPTTRDAVAELRAVTPDSLQYLLTDLFETVTLWDVATTRAVVEPTATGDYEVTLDVVAKKTRADRVGKQTEVPMDDLIEIGVFGPGTPGESLYLRQHRIRSGKQTIRITVAKEPARAGIDPYWRLIDRNGQNNVVSIERARNAVDQRTRD